MKLKLSIALVLTLVLVGTGWTQETQLKRYTTYQTSLADEDIMKTFVNEVRTYLQRYNGYYCWVGFEVHQDKDDQNYAWNTSTAENRYQWGTIYTIRLGITNAVLLVKFGNVSFKSGNQSAQEFWVFDYGIREYIVSVATSMFEESEMVLKMFNRNYSDSSKTAFFTNIERIHSE